MSTGGVAAARPSTAVKPLPLNAPPAHGLFTLLLYLIMVGIAASSVVNLDRADRTTVLLPLAFGGVLLGFVIAKTPSLDSFSAYVALLVGAASTCLLVAIRADGWEATRHARGRNALDLADQVVKNLFTGQARTLPDDDRLVLLGMTLWLVGGVCAWMLFRRFWLMPALTLPAVIVFICLRFEQTTSSLPLAIFGVASLLIAARNHALVRQVEWARGRIPVPRRFAARVTMSGAAVAIVALGAGLLLPFQAPDNVVNYLSDSFASTWDRAQREWQEHGGPTSDFANSAPDYSHFGDSFNLDGTFVESDEIVATLDALQPSYLTVRSYDVYNGHGWNVDVDSTFRMPGDDSKTPATSVTFASNQPVPLSIESLAGREPNAGTLTVYNRGDGLLLTMDTFSDSNRRSVAVVSWIQLPEQAIEVDSVDIGSLPVDLQGLVTLIRDTSFGQVDDNGEPKPINAVDARLLDAERAKLSAYPVRTRLQFSDDGGIILVLSGRVPNYDDIEAVYVNEPVDTDFTYRVRGLRSVASEDELRAAETNYPAWVSARYLQLPGTVTDRTKERAAAVVADAGATNPFDVAWAIQQYLRNNYQYELNPESGPEDQDYVDYFLFDRRSGRCDNYATAMVVMLRSLGIPSRIVSGFRDSEELTASGEYMFRGRQAHAWVEAYFPAYGWIPFEPTSSQSLLDYGQSDGAPVPIPTAEPELPESTPEATVESTIAATPDSELPPVVTNTGDSNWTDGLSGGLGALALGLTALVALLVFALFAVWAWGLRGLRPGAALYAKTIRIGKLWGVETHPAMTPGEYAMHFGETVPRAKGAARIVADIYTAERYGGVEISEDAHRSGEQAWHAVRRAVFGWRPWRRSRFG